MPYFYPPPEWSDTDHGFVYTKEEFVERILKPMQHLEKELGINTPFMVLLGGMSSIQLDVLLNGEPN